MMKKFILLTLIFLLISCSKKIAIEYSYSGVDIEKITIKDRCFYEIYLDSDFSYKSKIIKEVKIFGDSICNGEFTILVIKNVKDIKFNDSMIVVKKLK